jgi:hypothetical protein
MVLTLAHIVLAVASISPADGPEAQGRRCSGPGAAFGVTSYQCEKCGVSSHDGRTRFMFDAEPRVLAAEEGSSLRRDDIVVAVDGRSIRTGEGAEAFTYPLRGTHTVTVRRAGRRVDLTAEVTIDCTGGSQPALDGMPAAAAPAPQPAAGGSSAGTGRLGFALACIPSCTRTRGPDGSIYWKFDAEPTVAAVRASSPAAAAGVQVGDTVVQVDGKSILAPEGHLRLIRAQSGSVRSVTLTVRRGGVERTIDLTVERP